MTYSPLLRFSALVMLCGALLSGCCANDYCGRDDSKEDIIYLVFSDSPTKGFKTTDLARLVILRYPLIVTPATKPDSVTIIRTTAQAYDTLFLNNTAPFAQLGTARLNQYRYVIRYYGSLPLDHPATALTISRIALQGSFDGDGCCTYYTNTQKVVTARYTFANTDSTYNLRPSPILKIYKR